MKNLIKIKSRTIESKNIRQNRQTHPELICINYLKRKNK